MLTTFADVLLRIGTADPAALKDIYTHEIQSPGYSEDERKILLNAFDNRAAHLNAEALGLARPRWGQLAAQKGQ